MICDEDVFVMPVADTKYPMWKISSLTINKKNAGISRNELM